MTRKECSNRSIARNPPAERPEEIEALLNEEIGDAMTGGRKSVSEEGGVELVVRQIAFD